MILVTLAASSAQAKPRGRAARAEAQFVEGMRRFWRGGCQAASESFERAYAERPGGRQEAVARQWAERCRGVLAAYADLDSGWVAGPVDPYADLDGPPRDEPELE